jgi:hypothetical protein
MTPSYNQVDWLCIWVDSIRDQKNTVNIDILNDELPIENSTLLT